MSTPEAPLRDATPSEVQKYFTKILIDLHGISEPEAENIGKRWKYGRGSEIIYYDVDTYRAIFGPEVGTVLFGHARRELRAGRRGPSQGIAKTEEKERVTKDLFGLSPGATPLYLVFFLSLSLTWAAYSNSGPGREGLGIGAALSIVGFIVSYWIFYFAG